MSREDQEPTLDEWGAEEHPAFGNVQVNRVSSSHGVSLFDSELRHSHFVTLKVEKATRKRDLNRDWIHGGGTPYIEIAMSEAQWARMVSSLNSGGTPCTVTWVGRHDRLPGEGHIPSIPFEPRMAQSIDEVRGAARKLFERAQEALAAVEEKPTKANVRALRLVLDSAESNLTYTAKSMTEHAENTVQKAKADIEAMVDSRARQLGLDPTAITLELAEPSTDPKELL